MKIVYVIGLLGLGLTSCKAKPNTTPPERNTPPALESVRPAENAPITASVKAALGQYEAIRAALAADDTKGVVDAANQIAAIARKAKPIAAGNAKVELGNLADAADQLAREKGDIEAVRRDFGEVSKPLVALLAEDPVLRQGQHIYECPLATGYTKWIQPSDKVDDPYTGRKKIACGGPVDWIP